MSFIVTTALKKLYRLKKRKRVIQGGTSASKTFSILALLIDKAIKEDVIEISIVSESIPHLKRGAMKDFLKIMMLTGRFRSSQWNKSDSKYTFSNGSYIEFFSVDQPDKLRGARRNVLYINECNNVPFEAYLQLSTRTSGEIWLDFNPSEKFWCHTEVITEPDSDFIILTYKDNEGLPESIVKELESKRIKAKTSSYWENWCKVYLDGQIGSLQDACIPDWETIGKIPEEAQLLGYGMDFGFSNDASTIVALYKYEDAYIADEVLYKTGQLTSDLYHHFKQNAKDGLIYADPSSPMIIRELLNRGLNIMAVPRKGMANKSISYGLDLINENKLFITKRSKNLIEELQGYVFKKDKEGNTLNEPVGGKDHAIDALRYSFMGFVSKYLAGGSYQIY